jgi:hypothetical protein
MTPGKWRVNDIATRDFHDVRTLTRTSSMCRVPTLDILVADCSLNIVRTTGSYVDPSAAPPRGK